MPISRETQRQLLGAVREAKIRVVGYDLVKNESEAAALSAIVKAYGQSPAGFIYASPSRARTALRPPDVVLCHPDVGLLVVEVKGFGIEQIEGVEAGSILVRCTGYIKPENVIHQVETQEFDISRDVLQIVRDKRRMPLMNSIVALPRISQSEWIAKGYDKAHPVNRLLFKDQIENIGNLRKRVSSLVQETLRESGKDRPLDVDQVSAILQVFGNSDTINERRPPRGVQDDRLGAYVDEMMALEKYLSEEQKELSRLEFEGSQRLVRGVAGSGKSIVLAGLVARFLHRELNALQGELWPERRVAVAVTCFNHALVDFLRQKIRAAFKEQTLTDDIPSGVLTVTHLNNLMWHLMTDLQWPIHYIPIEAEKNSAARAVRYRQQIQAFAAGQPELYQNLCFDALFVDEGQDFEPEEWLLLQELVRPHPRTKEKTLVIFYDDAQNLYGRSRPVWKDLGINVAGERSRVMRECFRNTRQIVELAFNVLLGSQAPADVRVQTRSYADINYLKERGLVEETGDYFRVGFAEREYQVPEVLQFATQQQEIDSAADEIVRLIREQEVRPEDILVVFFGPSVFDVDGLQRKVASTLPELGFVKPFGKSTEDKDRYIFRKGCLTLSTVHGAKGYDAPIVFMVGTDAFHTDTDGRAAFYVGATRAKLILRVSGCARPGSLLAEAAALRTMM